MGNGRGKLDCSYCLHFQSEGYPDGFGERRMCLFHEQFLPAARVKHHHRICAHFLSDMDFKRRCAYDGMTEARRFAWFGIDLKPGVLYEFGYNNPEGIETSAVLRIMEGGKWRTPTNDELRDQSPRVNALRHRLTQAASAAGRRASGLYLLEGTRLVERALRAGVLVEACVGEFYGTPEREATLLAALADADIGEVVRLPYAMFAKHASGRRTGEVLGLARIPEPAELPTTGTVLVAVDVSDPGNTGALVRTALAAGADAFVAVGQTDPFHPKAVRTSMGSICKLPVRRVDLDSFEAALTGWPLLGTVCADGVPLPDCELGGERLALLVGSEPFGLPDDVVARLDQRATIPMRRGVDSFSVNAAAAIVLYARMNHDDDDDHDSRPAGSSS